MSGQKRKSSGSADGARRVWRDEIATDVFELWVGISRLMARVHGSDRPELAKRASGGRLAASRRPSRHRTA